ncbi:hypothetical protein EJ03DRAFT_75346 [Teratosphaeria nubilosa]|uniref:Uncharacterized protein n=1 Tax=Teratosphaeria nubilosa TaxID=161662 RepID=A0A6G1LMI1_9PEZI|nr:hypothetical protein EJ03DRAFT_75346 [Teratosphaeria nubilosa]
MSAFVRGVCPQRSCFWLTLRSLSQSSCLELSGLLRCLSLVWTDLVPPFLHCNAPRGVGSQLRTLVCDYEQIQRWSCYLIKPQQNSVHVVRKSSWTWQQSILHCPGSPLVLVIGANSQELQRSAVSVPPWISTAHATDARVSQ